jgi:hypothetical protein
MLFNNLDRTFEQQNYSSFIQKYKWCRNLFNNRY